MTQKILNYHNISNMYFTFNFLFKFFFILFVRVSQRLQYSNTYLLEFSKQIHTVKFPKLIQLTSSFYKMFQMEEKV